MEKFVAKKISEQQLLDLTSPASVYDAIYLCSAMTLPEHRNKGIAKRLTLEAIESIRKTNPVKELFVWPFSVEGKRLAESIAKIAGLPLRVRN
jgi:predicted GNAT family acetyltransferase